MKDLSIRDAKALRRKAMRRCVIGLAGLLLSAGVSNAQTTGQGYVVGGGGVYSNPFTSGTVAEVAGGGEALIENRLGIGGELGFVFEGSATASLKASLHFPNQRTSSMVPFVGGGYTRLAYLTDRGGANALNIGAGVTFWSSGRKGLLIEFRDVIYHALGTDQCWTIRVGMAFK